MNDIRPPCLLSLLLILSACCGASLPEMVNAESIPAGRVVSIETTRPVAFRLRVGTELFSIRGGASTPLINSGNEELRPGVAVRVDGHRTGNTISATEIELLRTTIGQIVAIQEVFPPRLVLDTGTEPETVELQQTTLVRTGEQKGEIGVLQNQQWIVAYGSQTTRRLKVDAIDVLTERTGRISVVREVSPPQFVMNTGSSTTEVRLDAGTSINRGPMVEKFDSLRPGAIVRVLGIATADRLSAFRIELR